MLLHSPLTTFPQCNSSVLRHSQFSPITAAPPAAALPASPPSSSITSQPPPPLIHPAVLAGRNTESNLHTLVPVFPWLPLPFYHSFFRFQAPLSMHFLALSHNATLFINCTNMIPFTQRSPTYKRN